MSVYYTPPSKNNIPFTFTSGGYQPPQFDNVAFNFSTKASQISNLSASINVMQRYQESTYTFLKYRDQYVIGYGSKGVQIIKGKYHYGGIRDLGSTVIGALPPQGVVDLIATLRGFVFNDLTTNVNVISGINLGGLIGAHQPVNLTAYIRGFAYRNLSASLNVMLSRDLSAFLNTVQPKDLTAYLKVWPQTDLFGSIYGWQEKDLSAYVNITFSRDLSAFITTHVSKDLKASLKGVVIEATRDLSANVFSYGLRDLPASIRGSEFYDLSCYLFPVLPKNLQVYIRGWQAADFTANIIGDDWPWNLTASIVSGGGFNNLSANIKSVTDARVYSNLHVYILTTRGLENLSAQIKMIYSNNLSACIDTGREIKNLSASIRPKTIRLTAILSIITMEHKDLSVTISIPCFYSDFRELSSYIRPVFLSDLGAIINPTGWVKGTSNLSARWGFADNYVVQDKLPITFNLSLAPETYRVEDKLKLYLQIYKKSVSLTASIFGEYINVDLPAYIYGVKLTPYDFERYTGRERVYSRTYYQTLIDFEDVTIEFEDIVRDYIYSSGSNVVAKTDRYQHFLTKISSYYSPTTSERIDSKLHKVKILYDLRRFDSVDDAVKCVIDYVTSYPYANVGAYIKAIGTYTGLSASVTGTTTVSALENLSSQIDGQIIHSYEVILGFTDDGVGYLQF